MDIDGSWDSRSVQVAPGDALRLTLEEKPGAGYLWRVEEDGAPVCRLASDEHESAGGKVGGSGLRRLSFEVVARGSARIALAYGRSWEAEPTRRFTVEVRAS